jgi:hypothetical protein
MTQNYNRTSDGSKFVNAKGFVREMFKYLHTPRLQLSTDLHSNQNE